MDQNTHLPQPAFPERPRLALIAHDGRKDAMEEFCMQWEPLLRRCELCGTGTTARRMSMATGLSIAGLLSGPMGGDQQIGAKAALGELDLVIFLRDPLAAQPHEPDVSALMRVCDVHDVALATNLSSARMAMFALELAMAQREGRSEPFFAPARADRPQKAAHVLREV